MKNERIIRRILSAAVIVLGISALYWGHGQVKKTMDARDWPRTRGTVISSAVKVERGDSGFMFSPRVRYEYSVAGKTYAAERVSFGDYADSERSVARRIVDRYHPGQEVVGYYDPEDPTGAVLEPAVVGGIWIPLIVGICCLLVGIVGVRS